MQPPRLPPRRCLGCGLGGRPARPDGQRDAARTRRRGRLRYRVVLKLKSWRRLVCWSQACASPQMKSRFLSITFLLSLVLGNAIAIEAPQGVVGRSGDQSVVLHWDRNTETNLFGYRVYRALTNTGPFALQSTS